MKGMGLGTVHLLKWNMLSHPAMFICHHMPFPACMGRLNALLLLWAVQFVVCSDVVVLKADNFEQLTSQEENMLVEFYAPWCDPCLLACFFGYFFFFGYLLSNPKAILNAQVDRRTWL